MPTMKELGLDRLSNEDRLALADELYDSVEAATPPGAHLTDAVRAMLEQRVADSDANPDDSVPAEEVHAAIRARLDRGRP